MFKKKLIIMKNRDFYLWLLKIFGFKLLNGIDILMVNWCCLLIIEIFVFVIYVDLYLKL